MPEIKVNIMNELKKIRNGFVYDNIASVIDELVQNSQRAKAKMITFNLKGDTLIIEDDGIGVNDLSILFEKSNSGWGNILASSKTPFGEGFFSTFFIADRIIAESKGKKAEVDVIDVIENGNLEFNIVKSDKNIKGLKVTLIGERIEKFYSNLLDSINKIAEVIPQKAVVNGAEVRKKDLLEIPRKVDFTLNIDNELYTARLSPNNSYYDLEIFYEYRKVCDYWFSKLQGNIHLKDGAVTLKAPDRKDIVKDEKYYRFHQQLIDDAKKVYKEFVKIATQDQLDLYAEKIAELLDVKDYLQYLIVDESLEVDKNINKEEKEEESINNFLNDWYQERRKDFDGNNIQVNMMQKKSKENKETKHHGKLIDKVKKLNKAVFVALKQLEDYKDEITKFEYYGFKILVAKNILFENAFRELGIPNIAEMQNTVKKVYKIDKLEPQSKKEMRALQLLRMIENKYGIHGIFKIGDIKMEIVTEINGEEVNREEMQVEGCFTQGTIILNRNFLQLPKFRLEYKEKDIEVLGLNDYRFLMYNLNTIAHELAHALYFTEDNTPEHFRAIEKLEREIADIFN